MTTTESIFEDSEIPDLVLETVIGFLVEMTPMEEWGEIRSVSKRWNRIAKPVMKEAFKKAWPKFVIPQNRQVTPFKLSNNRTFLRLACGQNYKWMFCEPISLQSVVGSCKPIGVNFTLTESGGACVGVWLIDSRKSHLFDTVVEWSPFYSEARHRVCAGSDTSICLIGACSGDLIVHDMSGMKRDVGHLGNLSLCRNWQYALEYWPGGRTTFEVTGGKRSFTGETTLEEGPMLAKHRDTAVVVFAVATSYEITAVTLRPKLP